MSHRVLIACLIIVSMTVHLNGDSIRRRFRYQMLRAHNLYRSRHCAPPLKLDAKLSRSAQEYAEQLARTNRFEHSAGGDYGENLYKMISTHKIEKLNGADATRSWYDEIQLYDFAQPQFSSETGHFTQIIWRETTKLGVGFAIAEENSHYALYVVAQYSPGGNVDGYFAENVLSTQC